MSPKKKAKIKRGIVTDLEIKKAVGKKIARKRDDLGHGSSMVAQKLEITREALSHIETGRNNINAVSLWKLASLFDCEVGEFFPKVPEGFSLNRLNREDTRSLKQEAGEPVVEWAKQLFGE